jgi:transposase-like protein
VSDKDKKEFATDLKSIYHAPSEEIGYETMVKVTEKWQNHYPSAMKSWSTNWDVISPIFKISKSSMKFSLFSVKFVWSHNYTAWDEIFILFLCFIIVTFIFQTIQLTLK